MGNKTQEMQPEPVSVHLQSASTVLDDLRGQATWEEEWMDNNPGMVAATNHERKVHLLSDLLGKADGVLAFREVLDASPALRALMSTADHSSSSTAAGGGATGRAGGDHTAVAEEAKYHLVQEKLSEGQSFKGGAAAAREASPREFYHHRDRLRSLLDREENVVCADCTARLPTWASVNTGVFLCTQCAGCHRRGKIGTPLHISKVLSVQLDDWTKAQVEFMAGMGNEMANSFLEYHVPSTWLKPSHLEPRDYRDAYIKAKYQSRLFEFRGKKKPVIKPPPPVDHGSMLLSGMDRDAGGDGGGERVGSGVSHGMTEYIGFVNINLVRGENLVPAGFGQQLQYMAVLRIGGQEVRSKWARKSDGSPLWSEKLMLCWDGNMPLNIDMYGGKDHIGQAQVPLRSLLLMERESAAEAGDDSSRGDRGSGSSNLGGLEPASRLLDNVLATPVPAGGGGGGSEGSEDDDGDLSFFETGDPQEEGGQDDVEDSLPSTVPSLVSSTSSGPPTLSSLSALAARVAAVHSKPEEGGGATTASSPVPSIDAAAAVPSATAAPDEKKSSSALTTVDSGGGGDGGGGNSTATSPYDAGGGGGVFAFAGSGTLKAGDGDKKVPGSAANAAAAAAARVENLLGEPKGGVEATSASIEKLPGGELYVSLEDKKEATTGDRFGGLSPLTGAGSVASSRGTSPRPVLSNKMGSNGNATGGLSTKSFNNMMLKLGKSGGTSGGSGGNPGHSQSRPAQGGVVIKMDFVRIEH
ncbi:unnamed protein product [Ectocarpus fasciculatus]